MNKFTLLHGEALGQLRSLPNNSVDSMITDPPAGIAFMGKDWDKDKGGRDAWIVWLAEIAREALRVMKPGAHGLVWALPRTSHWTATALEDAGFEIRDVVMHIFGSGFPKNMDVSKAIDKAAGAERDIIGLSAYAAKRTGAGKEGVLNNRGPGLVGIDSAIITTPATDEAKQWQGWGTALKPAAEHWIMVRKPIAEKTVAKNVVKYATGAINIDGSRIGTGDNLNGGAYSENKENDGEWGTMHRFTDKPYEQPKGRWPANVVLSHSDDCVSRGTAKVKGHGGYPNGPGGDHSKAYREQRASTTFAPSCSADNVPWTGHADADGMETVDVYLCTDDCPVKVLDAQSGHLKSGTGAVKRSSSKGYTPGAYGKESREVGTPNVEYGDSGGASRFFYVAKPSRKEKEAGLDDRKATNVNDGRTTSIDNAYQRGDTQRKNTHPTVKATTLMSYLCNLITPPGGTVLDPFMGSGTTGISAIRNGFRFIGIEQEPEYVEIARMRIEHAATAA